MSDDEGLEETTSGFKLVKGIHYQIFYTVIVEGYQKWSDMRGTAIWSLTD